MHNTSTTTNPSPSTRPNLKHHRTETLRPFVQKYQYHQLPLPEPRPLADEDALTPSGQATSDSGKPPCTAPCRENS